MNMVELIGKKKRGGALTDAELQWLVRGVADDSIPDYQLSAWLMAVCLKGMSPEETLALTLAMARSGDTLDLSSLQGVKGDKHSTGGVGDKTTLIVAPVVTACGMTVAKMSGRGLGHTGGTVDKLESIPGVSTSLSAERFVDIVRRIGLCVAGQSGELAPADKKLYALRDVTATVDSPALIAASVMSKKLAAGADCILLDVKTGSGAFMKTVEEAEAVAGAMVDIGARASRSCAAVITDMDVPLGRAVGNALEVREALQTLRGAGPEDLTNVSLMLCARLLELAAGRDASFGVRADGCEAAARKALADGSALEKFLEMIEALGGDAAVLREPDGLPRAELVHEVRALRSGVVTRMNAEGVGMASVLLGAGRLTKADGIDPAAGIILCKKTEETVREGETLALLHTSSGELARRGEEAFREAVSIGDEPPEPRPLVYRLIRGMEAQ